MRLFSYRLTSLAVSVLVGQSSPTLCNPVVWGPPGPPVHGNSSGKNIGVGHHFFLQGSFPHPGIQPGSPALQADSLPSEPLGKPDLADCISTHSKNKWLYAHGCEKGKALLRLVPCLQPQLFLWWQSPFSKTNWVSSFCLETLHCSHFPRPVVYCCWAFASEIFSIRQNSIYLKLWATHVLLIRGHCSWFPRLPWFLLWALAALFTHTGLHGFVYISALPCRLWIPGGQDHILFIFCYLTSSLGSGT